MKIHFIFPKWIKLLEDYPNLKEDLAGYNVGDFSMASLGIPTSISSIPEEHDVTITDENIKEINYDIDADLICISFFTPQASNAYEIADNYRLKGKRVLGGSIHPSMSPDDTLKHFDSVVIGPVEGLWPEIIRDLQDNDLKDRYNGNFESGFSQPIREIFSASTYLKAGIVQTARGCNVGCPFCIIPQCYGNKVYHKDINTVLEDIKNMPYKCFYFADENLIFPNPEDREYRDELLSMIIENGVRKIFYFAAYPFMIKGLNDKDIELLSKAGCRQVYLILGLFDPLIKELNDRKLIDNILKMQDVRIEMMSTFTVGHDKDPDDIDQDINKFCNEIKSNLAEFTIWTPFPGTPVFDEMDKAGRLLHYDWEKYNCANVVHQPLHYSPEFLREMYLKLWVSFYGDIKKYEMSQRYARGFGMDIILEENQKRNR